MFVVIPFSIINLISSAILEKNIEEKIVNAKLDLLRIQASNVEEILKDMMSAATMCSLDDNIIGILKDPDSEDLYSRLKYYDNLYSIISNSVLRKYECSITILDNHGHIYADWTGKEHDYIRLRSMDWFADIVDAKGGFVWVSHQESLVDRHEYDPINLSVAKLINDTTSKESVGVVLISISKNHFTDILKHSDTSQNILAIIDVDNNLIIDGNGNSSGAFSVFASIDSKTPGTITEQQQDGKSIINTFDIRFTDWRLIEVVDKNIMLAEVIFMKKLNYGISGLFLLVFIVLTSVISKNVSKKINSMRDQMLLMDNDNLDVVIEEAGSEEIIDLARTFNRMIKRVKQLIAKVEEEERIKQDLKFKALQAQINPHFIFNSLNNIKLLAYMNHAPQVGEMICVLGSLMEESIGKGEDTITIDKEVQYLQNYIYLQNIKYSDTIDFSVNISEELRGMRIVKFILQPIIENCIYHGIDQDTGSISIELRILQVRDDSIEITIVDSGIGIRQDTLQEIQKLLQEERSINSERVGIFNVNDRVKLSYGREYGLTISSTVGEGTQVTIVIPYKERNQDRV